MMYLKLFDKLEKRNDFAVTENKRLVNMGDLNINYVTENEKTIQKTGMP